MVATKKHEEEPFDQDEFPGIRFLTVEEGYAYFDRRSRELLDIPGDEFLRRWDAGEFRAPPDAPEDRKLNRLVMLLPFAGRTIA